MRPSVDSRQLFQTSISGAQFRNDFDSPGDQGMVDRAIAWRERGRATTMLRTASDGADVILEDEGLEWEVVEGHGTGKGHREKISSEQGFKKLRRR